MKSTFNPHNRRKINKCGFRKRMSTSDGRKILSEKRRKGRRCLTASDEAFYKGHELRWVNRKKAISNRKKISIRRRNSKNMSSRLAKTTCRRNSA